MRDASPEELKERKQNTDQELEQLQKRLVQLSKEAEKWNDAKIACREKRKAGMAAVTKEYMDTHQRIQQTLGNIRNEQYTIKRQIAELTANQADDKAE